MSFNANELGDLQIDVLRTLWTLGEATVHEVLGTIERQPPPAYTTVLTVLRSLEKRGLVAHYLPSGDRQYRYRPLLDAEEAERTAISDILQRVFEGSVERMVARVIEAHAVTMRDLCAIRCMLDRALESLDPPDGEARVQANGTTAALPEARLSESLSQTRQKLSRSLRRNTT